MDWYTFYISGKPTGQVIEKWKFVQVLRKSAFLMWIYDIYRSWANSSNYINMMLLGELDDDTRKNIRDTLESIEEVRSLSEEHGFHLTLVVIPLTEQVTRIFPDQVYQATLKTFAENTGIDSVDLLPDLRAHYRQYNNSLYIPFDGHYNSQGHRVMASSIFAYLDTLGLCQE